MALGVYAARSAGVEVPLYAPENGLIGMNIPLTPSRSGSCSTRTMHPYFLRRLGEILTRLGVRNQVVNPLELKTKGECILESGDSQLISSVVGRTVSCSHPTRKQYWKRRLPTVRNCGYCLPCVIRRAALNKAGLDVPSHYGIDVLQDELNLSDESESISDFLAVLNMLNSGKTRDDFKKDILSVANVDKLDERAAMIERGFEEIRLLVRQKGSRAVKRLTGIS